MRFFSISHSKNKSHKISKKNVLSGGFLSKAFSKGLCPGGFCLGGFCPDTLIITFRVIYNLCGFAEV